MKKDSAELLKCLNTHKHLYSQLLDKCEKKRMAIIANNINDLESILTEEAELVKKIEAVEGLRIKYTAAIAARLGIKGNATHEQLAEYDEEIRNSFGDIAGQLRKLLDRIKDINAVNNMLIQKRLAYVRDIKDGFLEDSGNNYGADGKDSRRKIQNTNLFDRMV